MPRNDDLDQDDRRDADEDAETSSPPPRASSHAGLMIAIVAGTFVLCCGGFVGVGFWLFIQGKEAVERTNEAMDLVNVNAPEPATGDSATADQSERNLQRIGSAMENHYHAHGFFPNNSYDAQAKLQGKASARPLLSWRVHILPYLEERNLYRQFKLDEPWDSAHNIRLLNQMPAVYGTPEANQRAGPGKTYYRGFSNPGGLFARRDMPRPDIPRPDAPGPRLKSKAKPEPPAPPATLTSMLRIADITDGLSNTILAVEAGDAVEWTKPDDLDASPGKPFPALGGARPKSDTIFVLFLDGTVRAVRKTLPEAQWRAGVTYAGNEMVNFD